MTLYRNCLGWTLFISFISLLMAFILDCFGDSVWYDIFIGTFSSGFLTVITSWIGYLRERNRVMEEFYEETKKMLKMLNEYPFDLNIDKKIDFFLDFSKFDISYWNRAYGDMSFICPDSRKYVYNKIYSPMMDIIKTLNSHSDNFRRHRNGTGTNDSVMESYIAEIEKNMHYNEQYVVEHVEEYPEYKVKHEHIVKSNSSRSVDKISKELNGRFYDIMCGKSNKKGK